METERLSRLALAVLQPLDCRALTGTPMHGNQQAATAMAAQEASVSEAVAVEIS